MTWPEKSFFFRLERYILMYSLLKFNLLSLLAAVSDNDRQTELLLIVPFHVFLYIETLYRRNSSRLILQIASPRHIDHTHSLRGIYVYICDAMNVEKIFPSDLYRSKIARRSLLCTMINPRLGYDNCPSSFTVTATNRKLGITRNDRRPIYILLHITAHRTMFDNSSR